MRARFVLGRAGCGKTHYCVTAILRALADESDRRRLILLVPEQASFQMERALATGAPRGGYTRAEVLSFSRLAQRVFAGDPAPPPVVAPPARTLALRYVATRLKDRLPTLRGAVHAAGFFAQLERLIEELLRENVSPAEFAAAAERLDDAAAARRCADLARLYQGYVDWLGRARVDPAARLAALRDSLDRTPWLAGARIWVDGFAGFTGQELETLAALARRAEELTITLLADAAAPALQPSGPRPDPLQLFHRTERTYQALRRRFDEERVEIAPPLVLHPDPLPRFAGSPALAALEAGLAAPLGESGPPAAEPGDAVRVVEFATHRDELRAAARWIRARLGVDPKLRWRDFAVIARDLGPLAHDVAEIFAEYEIPYFVDRRRPLHAHPLVRLVGGLFDAADADLDADVMVALLRTRLLPVSRDFAERIENLLVREALRGRGAWQAARWGLEEAGDVPPALDEARTAIVGPLLPLCDLAESGQSPTGAEWARTLHGVLEQLGVRRRLEQWIDEARGAQRWEAAEGHRLAWDAVMELLDNLHDVLHDTAMTMGEVADVCGVILRETTLGLAPPTVDQVLVGSIERSRHPDIRNAWLIAFNEGVFLAARVEDALLPDAQRAALTAAGLAAPAPRQDETFGERLLMYIACTRPSGELIVSYAKVGADGRALMPSPLLDEILRALPALRVRRPAPDPPPVGVRDLARHYLEAHAAAPESERARRLAAVCDRVRESPRSAELAWLLRGIAYRNAPPAVGNFRAPGDADVVWRASPSEVETYLQCPFQHFAKYGLELDPQRGPQPLRWDLGSDAHAILADVTQRARRRNPDVRAIDDAGWRVLTDEALADHAARTAAAFRRRPDYAFLSTLLAERVRDVVAAHAARWRRGDFLPRACEIRFDPSEERAELKALVLRLDGGGVVHIAGKIDRLDVCKVGDDLLALVYDYKSQAGSVRTDVLTRERLQVLLYLAAIDQALAAAHRVRVAGVLLAPLYADVSVLKSKYTAELDATTQLMCLLRPVGLVTEEAARHLDHELCGAVSPVARIRLKRDGQFYKNCDARPAEELRSYLELARQTVQTAAEGIGHGTVDIAPLVEKRTLACRWCDFRPLCRFDRAFNLPRAAEVTLPRRDGAADDAAAGGDE